MKICSSHSGHFGTARLGRTEADITSILETKEEVVSNLHIILMCSNEPGYFKLGSKR